MARGPLAALLLLAAAERSAGYSSGVSTSPSRLVQLSLHRRSLTPLPRAGRLVLAAGPRLRLGRVNRLQRAELRRAR